MADQQRAAPLATAPAAALLAAGGLRRQAVDAGQLSRPNQPRLSDEGGLRALSESSTARRRGVCSAATSGRRRRPKILRAPAARDVARRAAPRRGRRGRRAVGGHVLELLESASSCSALGAGHAASARSRSQDRCMRNACLASIDPRRAVAASPAPPAPPACSCQPQLT